MVGGQAYSLYHPYQVHIMVLKVIIFKGCFRHWFRDPDGNVRSRAARPRRFSRKRRVGFLHGDVSRRGLYLSQLETYATVHVSDTIASTAILQVGIPLLVETHATVFCLRRLLFKTVFDLL